MENNNETDCFIYAIIHVSNCSNITEKSAYFNTYGKLWPCLQHGAQIL